MSSREPIRSRPRCALDCPGQGCRGPEDDASPDVSIPQIDVMRTWRQSKPASLPMRRKKVIQTEVDPVVYSFVLRTAEAKGLTLKEAARQALSEWASREGDLSWDPLFDLSKTFSTRKRTDASKVDEVLHRRRKR